MRNLRFILISIAVAATCLAARAQQSWADWSVGAVMVASGENFSPYYIGSLQHGKLTQALEGLLDGKIKRDLSLDKRFSWGFGAEGVFGHSSTVAYDRYYLPQKEWGAHEEGPATAWIQQFYGEIKYRGVFLTVGMKERGSALLNQRLSSGDLVESGNARPIPEARIGFIDFQDIPFTNGWVQIQGEISYGKMMDNQYLKDHYNYYNYHINLGSFYSYKRCYFRTKPSQPFSVTVGMQVGAFFGGETQYYSEGRLTDTKKYSSSIKTMLKIFLPIGENGEDYYAGSTLGSWDLKARYRLHNNDEIYAYISWPWEDGSSIGRMNKWDGIWGVEYKSAQRRLINGFVLEYIDFRDQCGPIHWAPGDAPGTSITTQATGRDNYYNNYYYNSYANYGMAIGTPFLPSPIYNLNGYPAFVCNRANGFHLGMEGAITKLIDYRVLAGYQRGLGTYTYPFAKVRTNTSFMLEGRIDASAYFPGISITAQVGGDFGDLRGDNFGACFTITYNGKIGK